MNVWDYFAARPPWAISVAFWSLWGGGWAAACTRAWEILADEDQPTATKEQP